MELKMMYGIPPGGEDSELISKIINLQEISTKENDWLSSEVVVLKFPRFKSAFLRQLDKFNSKNPSQAPKVFRFKTSKTKDNTYTIWRLS